MVRIFSQLDTEVSILVKCVESYVLMLSALKPELIFGQTQRDVVVCDVLELQQR